MSALAVIDYEAMKRRWSSIINPEGRLREDAPHAQRNVFFAEAFARPAKRLLRPGGSRPALEEIRRWMEYLNDQEPTWRTLPIVRRFCRTRRRELLVEACIREDLDLYRRALGFAKAFAAWKSTQTERLRHARRIARIMGMRLSQRRMSGERRDCLFVIRRLTLGGMERAQVSVANAVASLGRTVDILNLGDLNPTIVADLDTRVQLIDTTTALRRRYLAAVNYSNWHFPEIVVHGVQAERRIQWVHSDLLWIFDRFPRDKWAFEYRRMDKVVCVSEYSRKGFSILYPFAAARAETIHSFYDMEPVRRRASEPPAIVFPRDLPVVITVARLADPKGLERAVRVHRRVADAGVDFRWYVVGEGTMRSKIESLIREHSLQDRFILLGEMPNPFPLMKQADVFVLPSFHEGFGLTTLEAMTLQMPILLAEFGSARESVTHGFNGVVARGNVRCLTDALQRLLTDSALRERLRQNLAGFMWDNAAILAKVNRVLFGLVNA